MSITTALESICTHRDVVPLYYDRRTGSFIVTGVYRTHSGAFVVDSDGRIGMLHDSKRAALASITPN